MAYKHLELDLTCTSWGDFETGVRRVHEAFTDDSFRSELTTGTELDYYGTANRAQLATVLMHYDALNK